MHMMTPRLGNTVHDGQAFSFAKLVQFIQRLHPKADTQSETTVGSEAHVDLTKMLSVL
jgi:hypothetical protein